MLRYSLLVWFFLVFPSSVHAFNCPEPEDGQTQITCIQEVKIVSESEPEDTKNWLAAGTYVARASISSSIPVYLCLMGIGVFSRLVKGRVS